MSQFTYTKKEPRYTSAFRMPGGTYRYCDLLSKSNFEIINFDESIGYVKKALQLNNNNNDNLAFFTLKFDEYTDTDTIIERARIILELINNLIVGNDWQKNPFRKVYVLEYREDRVGFSGEQLSNVVMLHAIMNIGTRTIEDLKKELNFRFNKPLFDLQFLFEDYRQPTREGFNGREYPNPWKNHMYIEIIDDLKNIVKEIIEKYGWTIFRASGKNIAEFKFIMKTEKEIEWQKIQQRLQDEWHKKYTFNGTGEFWGDPEGEQLKNRLAEGINNDNCGEKLKEYLIKIATEEGYLEECKENITKNGLNLLMGVTWYEQKPTLLEIRKSNAENFTFNRKLK